MKKRILSLSFYLCCFLILSQSCAPVRLISEYDETTYKTLTSLQENLATYFVKLERQIGTEPATYSHYIDFFDKTKIDLKILSIRAKAIEKNSIISDQIDLLTSTINNLESLHKIGFQSPAELTPIWSAVRISLSSMLKLQIALKR